MVHAVLPEHSFPGHHGIILPPKPPFVVSICKPNHHLTSSPSQTLPQTHPSSRMQAQYKEGAFLSLQKSKMHRGLKLCKQENRRYSLQKSNTITHHFITLLQSKGKNSHHWPKKCSGLKTECNCIDVTSLWILLPDFKVTKKKSNI